MTSLPDPLPRDDKPETWVSRSNELAREFYRAMGYVRPVGFRFDRASHPQEQLCWLLAKISVEFWFATDLDDMCRQAQKAWSEE